MNALTVDVSDEAHNSGWLEWQEMQKAEKAMNSRWEGVTALTEGVQCWVYKRKLAEAHKNQLKTNKFKPLFAYGGQETIVKVKHILNHIVIPVLLGANAFGKNLCQGQTGNQLIYILLSVIILFTMRSINLLAC